MDYEDFMDPTTVGVIGGALLWMLGMLIVTVSVVVGSLPVFVFGAALLLVGVVIGGVSVEGAE